MTSKLTRYIIQSKIADFFAGVIEIHTKLGGPNTAEEAQNQLTERVLACVPVVDSEPYGFTDGDRRGMIYEPQYADRLNKPIPVYRHAQPAPVVPDDVMDALQKVARIRLDLNDFDGDCRGIADCLSDAEEALIEVVNRRAAMLNGGKS